MSFQELAEKANTPLGGLISSPYFSQEQIQLAKQLITQSEERAAEVKAAAAAEPKAETPVKVTKSAQAATN